MLQTATESKTAGAAAPRPDLQLFRPEIPYVALGLAVNHLMVKPAFAQLRFGDWSRILVGQINREHYRFMVNGKIEFKDFIGWALATRDKAEAWVEGRRRAVTCGQQDRRVPGVQRLGAKIDRGEPLHACRVAQDHCRQGDGVFQAPLQGWQHQAGAPERQ